jgi:hypothetical protein
MFKKKIKRKSVNRRMIDDAMAKKKGITGETMI